MDKRSNIKEKVGRKIAELRKEAGLTQEQLAVKTNLDRTFIGYLEKGNRSPSLETSNKIARALGIKIEDIFKVD
jgi:DNA-binding XRE family transcriptional regulator